jgi:hypothetical protein
MEHTHVASQINDVYLEAADVPLEVTHLGREAVHSRLKCVEAPVESFVHRVLRGPTTIASSSQTAASVKF